MKNIPLVSLTLGSFLTLFAACAVDAESPETYGDSTSALLAYCDQMDPLEEVLTSNALEVGFEQGFGFVLNDEGQCTDPSDPFGAGGTGTGGGSCWPATTFTGQAVMSSTDAAHAALQARLNAVSKARRACENSAWVCTPRATVTSVTDTGCYQDYAGQTMRHYCTAAATVQCTYSVF